MQEGAHQDTRYALTLHRVSFDLVVGRIEPVVLFVIGGIAGNLERGSLVARGLVVVNKGQKLIEQARVG